MADVAKKREESIAKAEQVRNEKNKQIKAVKDQKAAERVANKLAEEAAAQAAADEKAALEEKRAQNIEVKTKTSSTGSAKKTVSAKKTTSSSTVHEKEVKDLKAIFDGYDTSGDGKVSLGEFTAGLKKQRELNAPKPGQKSTLEQRQATKGISIVDLGDQVFNEMDTDGDGEVTFRELCKLMFRHVREAELEAMMDLVKPPEAPPPPPKAELTQDAKEQIKALFKMYDKNKDGKLSVAELKKNVSTYRDDADLLKEELAKFDENGDGAIDYKEFEALMESTGAFDDI